MRGAHPHACGSRTTPGAISRASSPTRSPASMPSFAPARRSTSATRRVPRARPSSMHSLAQGWLFRQDLIWLKPSIVMGHSDYHFQHEPVIYGYKPDEGRLGRGGTGWYGGNRQSSVLEVDRPAASRQHPTMEPPELIEIALRNSSRRGRS